MLDQIIAYETGNLSQWGILKLFSELVKTGQAWTLQGSYGRTAARLIEDGYLTPEGEIDMDTCEYIGLEED